MRGRARTGGGLLVKTTHWIWILHVVTVAVAIVAFAGGYVAGSFRGGGAPHRMHYQNEERDIAPVLASDPAFSGVTVWEAMDGYANFDGGVETEADYGRLWRALQKEIGSRRTKELMGQVRVRETGR